MQGIVAPSLLSADFSNLQQELKLIEQTKAKWLHLDVMDGHFVNNITFGPPLVKSIRKSTNLFLDTHLMISKPAKYIEAFSNSGSDLITFHYEACADKQEILKIIDNIRKQNKKVGLSIKPATPAENIFEFLPLLDLVLVMTVEPGFGGQSFMETAAEKISIIRDFSNDINIQVDGGINADTSKIAVMLGANVLVAGSYVFKNNNYQIPVNELCKALENAGFEI